MCGVETGGVVDGLHFYLWTLIWTEKVPLSFIMNQSGPGRKLPFTWRSKSSPKMDGSQRLIHVSTWIYHLRCYPKFWRTFQVFLGPISFGIVSRQRVSSIWPWINPIMIWNSTLVIIIFVLSPDGGNSWRLRGVSPHPILPWCTEFSFLREKNSDQLHKISSKFIDPITLHFHLRAGSISILFSDCDIKLSI